MKKKAKTKGHKGNIQFDVWGNVADYSYGYNPIQHVYPKNLVNGGIELEMWDYSLGMYVMKPIAYTPEELDFKYVDPMHGWVATINKFVEVPNYEFNDTLKYEGHISSRSSTYFCVKSTITGKTYNISIRHLQSFIEKMDKGVIDGRFTFVKRGSSGYGLIIV